MSVTGSIIAGSKDLKTEYVVIIVLLIMRPIEITCFSKMRINPGGSKRR